MAEKRTIICRCEDIALEDIRELVKKGYRTIDEIKRISRATMGPCQGRTCRALIAQVLAQELGVPVGEIEQPRFRPPTKPITLGAIVRGADHEE
ncbi:MAG: (2Fe-2S)-binding protein [Chloroflexota bacterium]